MGSGENNTDFGADQIHDWNLMLLHFCRAELGEANLESSFPLLRKSGGWEWKRNFPFSHWSLVCGFCVFQDEIGAGKCGSVARVLVEHAQSPGSDPWHYIKLTVLEVRGQPGLHETISQTKVPSSRF